MIIVGIGPMASLYIRSKGAVEMNFSEQMMSLLSTQSLVKMALGYSRKDAKEKLDRIDLQFWDAINAELIRRGAL